MIKKRKCYLQQDINYIIRRHTQQILYRYVCTMNVTIQSEIFFDCCWQPVYCDAVSPHKQITSKWMPGANTSVAVTGTII